MMTTSIRDLPVVVNTMIGLIKQQAKLQASSQSDALRSPLWIILVLFMLIIKNVDHELWDLIQSVEILPVQHLDAYNFEFMWWWNLYDPQEHPLNRVNVVEENGEKYY